MKIVPERLEKYKSYLYKNIDSLFDKSGPDTPAMPASYILVIMYATEMVGEALDEGATPEQASEEMKDLGLTGYMAGIVAFVVANYSIRGGEFREWWNDRYGEKEDTGTVNSALMTISTKEKKNGNKPN